MAYFGNDTVNRLNLHYAIHALSVMVWTALTSGLGVP